MKPAAMAVALAALIAWPCGSGAQMLNDPTRPPAGINSIDRNESVTAAPVLQSVMITPSSRSAVIGGETVKLGGRYGEARVVKITESEVVLRSGSATDTLKMYPGVELTPIKPSASVPAAKKPARKARPKSK